MRPLDPLASASNVGDLLKAAPASEVEYELRRLEGALPTGGLERAAWQFARGALELRKGELAAARSDLEAAAGAFGQLEEVQAAALSTCEAQLALLRMGPYAVHARVRRTLHELADSHASDKLIRATATHYLGTAHRFSGNVEATMESLAEALDLSEGLLAERAQVLNSLGTLYVVLGVFGAAEGLLAHAAELAHQLGDKIGEAISHGQLGSAALAQHHHDVARIHLQKQEWLASRTGDAFGQARALTMLAELALDMGRHGDAQMLADHALRVAQSVTPPLPMWSAYATRVALRARIELGDPPSRHELERCRDAFRQQGNRLGAALIDGDLSRLDPKASETSRSESTWVLASLGLSGRVAQQIAAWRTAGHLTDPALDDILLLASAAQGHPHIAHALEHELVYHAPAALARIGKRRMEGQRNLGRLAALALEPAGLYVAAVERPGADRALYPDAEARAAAISTLGPVSVWAWSAVCPIASVVHDLGRGAGDGDLRVVLAKAPAARVATIPFLGEPGTGVTGVDMMPLMARLGSLPLGGRHVLAVGELPWDPRAEAAGATWRLRVTLEEIRSEHG